MASVFRQPGKVPNSILMKFQCYQGIVTAAGRGIYTISIIKNGRNELYPWCLNITVLSCLSSIDLES